ncbi:glutamate racemase [Candidatus Saccharibacteria bacterium]|nr:glutamate racemase [Candidatus Saccharibacteria bacterium]
MKIGVFDSGIGGLSVARAIKKARPDIEVIFRHDMPEHFPYATKTPDEIFTFVVPVLQSLIDDGCVVIVVACNTVSTTLIGRLRQQFDIPLVAIEPMVKPAASMTKQKIIAVCATPTTLASPRYAELKELYAQGITVLEPDCEDWSRLIEQNAMTEARLRQEIEPALAAGADIVVLGCTHYHWVEEAIRQIAEGRAYVLQPEEAIINRLTQVLAQLA